MIAFETQVRVRYGETDRMGYVYYGKYAEYFEVGRAELVRHLGIPYKYVEDRGILMPVAELDIRYKRPAYYDDLLTIRTSVPELPRSSFPTAYEIRNEAGELIVTGFVRLAFIDKARMAPVRVPAFVLDAILPHWPVPQP
ncbi:MAG: thioesterase family protein [Bacteroidia bacterium]|nr:thioesterase family protein [Bacteroidia bacterium]